MADIRKTRNHSLTESELQSHLENLAVDMERQFGIQCDFREKEVHLSGSAVTNGKVTWTSEFLTIELTLGLLAKMFKYRIEEEIEKHMDAIVGSNEI